MKNPYLSLIAAAAMVMGVSSVQAQESVPSVNSGTEKEAMPGMDHSQMDHSQMQHGDTPAAKPETDGHGGHGSSGGMDHGSMQGGSAPADARDPHAYSGGYDFGPMKLRLADQHNFLSVLVDSLEAMRTSDSTSMEYDLQAWYGRTYDRVVFKAEGDADDGRLEDARTELLWGHAIASYWDAQLGVRYDSGEGLDRAWLAFGIQGLAPYWFEVDAAAYLGDEGRTALRLDAEYELLLTQKLILQPKVEMNLYGKSDPERDLGSGLSDVSVALRLRYEIWREFAPYIGIERLRKFGDTADFARATGRDTGETRLLAGLRFWF